MLEKQINVNRVERPSETDPKRTVRTEKEVRLDEQGSSRLWGKHAGEQQGVGTIKGGSE